jgi:predicted small secreted protein
MKKLFVLCLLTVTLSACSTSAGLVKGIGEDVKSGTDWAASKIKSN